MIKSTYGIGAFALPNIGGEPAASRHRLLTAIAHRLGAIAVAAEVESLAARVDLQQRPYLVPGFVGLGAPYWSPRARGALIGLTAECGLAEIARAALKAVGRQTRDLVEATAADAGIEISASRIDGGMAVSDWTTQFLADILPATVERPALVKTTAWGAASVAGA